VLSRNSGQAQDRETISKFVAIPLTNTVSAGHITGAGWGIATEKIA
jgi:hypothetical protein